MNDVTRAVADMLSNGLNAINAGNSNLSEEGVLTIMKAVVDATDLSRRINKHNMCKELHISRTTFDNYVRSGKIPKGTPEAGSKELKWTMKDVKDFKDKYWKH